MSWIDSITPQPSPAKQALTRLQQEQAEHEQLLAHAAQMVTLLRDGLDRAHRTPQLVNPYYQDDFPGRLASLRGWLLPWGRIWLLDDGRFVEFVKVERWWRSTWRLQPTSAAEALRCFIREGSRLFLKDSAIHFENSVYYPDGSDRQSRPLAEALLDWVNSQT